MTHEENSTIEGAARRLREMAMAAKEGELLGNEDALTRRLLVSVSSIRQAARLLEREGLLRVKRGRNGGYLAARPGERTIQAAVAHIDVGVIEPAEIHIVATATWTAAVKRVAATPSLRVDRVIHDLASQIRAVKKSASFDEVRVVDKAIRSAIFKLSALRHLELISNINTVFAGRAFPSGVEAADAERNSQFVESWKKYALLQIDGIEAGDEQLAAFAAQRVSHVMLEWLSR